MVDPLVWSILAILQIPLLDLEVPEVKRDFLLLMYRCMKASLISRRILALTSELSFSILNRVLNFYNQYLSRIKFKHNHSLVIILFVRHNLIVKFKYSKAINHAIHAYECLCIIMLFFWHTIWNNKNRKENDQYSVFRWLLRVPIPCIDFLNIDDRFRCDLIFSCSKISFLYKLNSGKTQDEFILWRLMILRLLELLSKSFFWLWLWLSYIEVRFFFVIIAWSFFV